MARKRRFILRGNTYPVRATLHAMGAQWDPSGKVWVVCGANMHGAPYHHEEPRYRAIERAIQEGRLPGVRIELED
jgi:hypothetical protein